MRNHKKAHSRVNGLLQCFTVLILKDKTVEFRITCIMIILEKLTFMPLVHLQQINTEMVQYSCPCKKKKNGHYVANG